MVWQISLLAIDGMRIHFQIEVWILFYIHAIIFLMNKSKIFHLLWMGFKIFLCMRKFYWEFISNRSLFMPPWSFKNNIYEQLIEINKKKSKVP